MGRARRGLACALGLYPGKRKAWGDLHARQKKISRPHRPVSRHIVVALDLHNGNFVYLIEHK
jgi:hypothetical protein